jgi:L-serine kinase (ADP)
MASLVFFKVSALLCHEQVKQTLVRALIGQILAENMLHFPIIVDQKTGIILDGHHRFHALKQLGATLVPALAVDYQSPRVHVFPRRKHIPVTKQSVLAMSQNGGIYPPKTTRHVLPFAIPQVDIPLAKLQEVNHV